MDYEKKYKDLVDHIETEFKKARERVHDTKEPEWPDLIDDRKKVIWFRNGVFDAAFERGRYGQLVEIEGFIKDQTK